MGKKHSVPKLPTEPSLEAKDNEVRERLFKESYEELVKKQISNSENFDRSVLTLSASGLGLSLGFIKDIAPLAHANGRELLISSWGLFGVAIIATIASFMTSQAGIRFQIYAAKKYYLERDDDFLAKTSVASKATDVLNFTAGATFIGAIVGTIFFVVLNLPSQS
jgi:hypothetical protein